MGQKRRKDIDKSRDIYHAVFVLVITLAKEVVLSRIPARADLPNLYAERLGATVATIRRHNETAVEAARRALAREIHYEDSAPQYLGSQFLTLADGHKTFASAYYLVSEAPTTFSGTDIAGLTLVTAGELDDGIPARPERFAPTLEAIWRLYRERLPV